MRTNMGLWIDHRKAVIGLGKAAAVLAAVGTLTTLVEAASLACFYSRLSLYADLPFISGIFVCE